MVTEPRNLETTEPRQAEYYVPSSETLRDIRIRHIRFSELRKIQIAQTNFTNGYVIRLLQLEIYIENIVGKGEIAPAGLMRRTPSPTFGDIRVTIRLIETIFPAQFTPGVHSWYRGLKILIRHTNFLNQTDRNKSFAVSGVIEN